MTITQDVRDYAAKNGIAEETAAIAQGLREKAEEFRKGGGQIYRRAGAESSQRARSSRSPHRPAV